MAFDIEAIKRKMAELNGVKKSTSSIQMWKPEPRKPEEEPYVIRCLPWKVLNDDGQPIAERWFYYLGNGPGILAPYQFKKPDPVNDLIKSLYNSGKPDDRQLAYKLRAKLRGYLPIIVRGQEAKGVQVWSFSKTIYQKLLAYNLDEEVGDILDPEEGFDIKVSVTKQAGKTFNDTVPEAARRSSKLSKDPEQAKAWLAAIPNLDDMYKLKTEEEIRGILDRWLNSASAVENDSDGTSKGESTASDELDELDKLVNDVKSESSTKTQKPKSKKSSTEEKEDASPETKNLDDAFADLLSE